MTTVNLRAIVQPVTCLFSFFYSLLLGFCWLHSLRPQWSCGDRRRRFKAGLLASGVLQIWNIFEVGVEFHGLESQELQDLTKYQEWGHWAAS